MKTKLAIALGLALAAVRIDRPAQPGLGWGAQRRGGPPGGADGEAPGAAALAVHAALDANADHVLSAAEIAGAPAALLTLDANKDGELMADELRGLARGQAGPQARRRGAVLGAGAGAGAARLRGPEAAVDSKRSRPDRRRSSPRSTPITTA